MGKSDKEAKSVFHPGSIDGITVLSNDLNPPVVRQSEGLEFEFYEWLFMNERFSIVKVYHFTLN